MSATDNFDYDLCHRMQNAITQAIFRVCFDPETNACCLKPVEAFRAALACSAFMAASSPEELTKEEQRNLGNCVADDFLEAFAVFKHKATNLFKDGIWKEQEEGETDA